MDDHASYVIGVLTWLKPSDEIGGMMLLPSRDDAIDRLTLLFRALGSGGGGGWGGYFVASVLRFKCCLTSTEAITLIMDSHLDFHTAPEL